MTDFYVQLSEDQALDLASGYVPHAIVTAIRAMLDWQRIDERRAERPVKTPKPQKGPHATATASDSESDLLSDVPTA